MVEYGGALNTFVQCSLLLRQRQLTRKMESLFGSYLDYQIPDVKGKEGRRFRK